MPLRSIRLFPDPVLREVARPVEDFDERLERLVADMVETMHAAPGIGLAAPQVGVSQRVAVVDLSVGEDADQLLVLVNPEVEAGDELETDTEGCLSIPELTDKVTRPERIVLRARDLRGAAYELEADGLLARAVQHEVDHLDGVLFVDYLRGLRRERAKRHLRRLQRTQSPVSDQQTVAT